MRLRVSVLVALTATSLLISSPVDAETLDDDEAGMDRGCTLGFIVGALGSYGLIAAVIGPSTVFTPILAFSVGGIGGCLVAIESLESPRKN